MIDAESRGRLRDLLAARVVAANDETPLFVAAPEWAARFYLLTVESDQAAALHAQLTSQVGDLEAAVQFIRAFMTRARDLATTKRSLYLDESTFNGVTRLLSLDRLEGFLAPMVSDLDGAEADTSMREDMTDADDATVARAFLLISRRVRESAANEGGETTPTS